MAVGAWLRRRAPSRPTRQRCELGGQVRGGVLRVTAIDFHQVDQVADGADVGPGVAYEGQEARTHATASDVEVDLVGAATWSIGLNTPQRGCMNSRRRTRARDRRLRYAGSAMSRMWAASRLSSSRTSIRTGADLFSDLERRLPTLRDIPTLPAFGAHDHGYQAGAVPRFAKLLPRHAIEVFERSAHFPLLDEPARVTGAFAKFLDASYGPARAKSAGPPRRAARDAH